jgi:transcriptional regulator with XRE-family HTH domain
METDIAQNKELGRELARVRELAKLTQTELAARLVLQL